MKNAFSIRLDDLTKQQLEQLAAKYDTTQARIVSTAIDRMFQQEKQTMNTQFTYKGFDVQITEQLGGYGYETTDDDGNGISFPDPRLNTPAYPTVADAIAEAKRRITRYHTGIESTNDF